MPPGTAIFPCVRTLRIFGAGSRVRTRDPLITNQVLYQLSYTGMRRPLAFLAPYDNGEQ
jgi:hypothetical protein